MSEYEMESDIEELDDSWIKEIEEEEKDYNSFYKEENDTINIFYIYINKHNKIYYVKKDNIILNNNTLEKTKLLFLLKNNKSHNKINHKLISILQYNMDLSPEEIGNYLKKEENYNFLSIKSNLTDIKWDDTINLFKSLIVYIVYYEDIKRQVQILKRYISENEKA